MIITRNFNYSHTRRNMVVRSELVHYHLNNITNATELNFSKPEISLTFKVTSNDFIKLESAEMKVEEIRLIEIKPNVTNTTNTT